jgi:hypothetical protein
MNGFLSPGDLADQDVAKESDLYCEPPEKEFVIAAVQPKKYSITIPLPVGSETKPRQLIGEQGGKKFAKIADAAPMARRTGSFNLWEAHISCFLTVTATL